MRAHRLTRLRRSSRRRRCGRAPAPAPARVPPLRPARSSVDRIPVNASVPLTCARVRNRRRPYRSAGCRARCAGSRARSRHASASKRCGCAVQAQPACACVAAARAGVHSRRNARPQAHCSALDARTKQKRRVFPAQPLQHLARRTGIGPRLGVADRDLAAVGETRLAPGAHLPLDHRDVDAPPARRNHAHVTPITPAPNTSTRKSITPRLDRRSVRSDIDCSRTCALRTISPSARLPRFLP